MNRVLIPEQFSAAVRAGPDRSGEIIVLDGDTMGTRWSLKVVAPYGYVRAPLWAAVQAELDDIVEQMSTWDARSVLSRYNTAAADSWHPLPSAFAQVIDAALSFAAATDGAYDPAIGALVDRWGFGPTPRTSVPDDDEIAALRARSGWQRLRYDAETQRLHQPGGLALDLSSIAKGYAVDRVAAVVRAAGLRHFLAEIGGELLGEGCKPDGQPWWVALEAPEDAVSSSLQPIIAALDGLAIATSGDYRRVYEQAQQRYSHTLDPRSGRPITHGLASVTVLHPCCMDADALATALMVLGPVEGPAYAERHGLIARFITRSARDDEPWHEHLTPALQRLLQ